MIRYQVNGKVTGHTMLTKRDIVRYDEAVKLKEKWDQNGANMIVGDCWQHVVFDSVEITAGDVLWRR